ncbi:MAG: hypothetical protein HC774_05260, partial [Sphingomonadales bacterium]|nr:hypothetical protein [Sphingomonadales bacterium]
MFVATGLWSFGNLDILLGVALVLSIVLGLVAVRSSQRLDRRSFAAGRLAAVATAMAITGYFGYEVVAGDDAQRFISLLITFLSVPFTHWASLVELVVLIAVIAYLNTNYDRSIWKLTEAQAFILRDSPQRAFRTRLIRTALGIPSIVDFVPSRRPMISVLFVLGNFFYAMSTVFVFVGVLLAMTHWADVLETCAPPSGVCIASKAVAHLNISVGTAIVSLLVAPLLGGLLNLLAQRQIRLSMNELMTRDQRAPVLFLRPFADDQVRLATKRLMFLARAGRWLAATRNLDVLLLNEATPYGPVVAIGNPKDRLPPYGAARVSSMIRRGRMRFWSWQTTQGQLLS